MTGTNGNPYLNLVVNEKFGPPQNGYGAGVYPGMLALQWALLHQWDQELGPSGIDGRWGNWTMAALQRHLGQTVSTTWSSADVVAIQARCGWCGFPTTEDGSLGPKTAGVLQLSLNSTRF